MKEFADLFERKKIKYLLYLILAIMAAISVLQGIRNAVVFSQDFQYDAAKALALGVNPYLESLSPSGKLSALHLEDYYLQMEANQFPSLLLLLLPFTVFGPLTARYLWLICNLFLTAGILFLLKKTFLKKISNEQFLLLSLLMLAGTPYRNQLGVGQHTLFAFFFFLLAVYFADKEKGVIPTILALCICYFKYTLTLPLALYFLYKKKYKELLSSALVHLVLTELAAIWLKESFANMIRQPLQVASSLLAEGGIDFGALFGGTRIAALLAFLFMLGLTILAVLAPEGLDGELIAVLLLWSLIIVYHRSYDFFVLILVAAFFAEKGKMSDLQEEKPSADRQIEVAKLSFWLVLVLIFFGLRIFHESTASRIVIGTVYYLFTFYLTGLFVKDILQNRPCGKAEEEISHD